MAKQSSLPRKQVKMQAEISPRKQVLHVVRGLAADSARAQFDRIIHDRVRLAIISALAVNEKLTFSELKQLLEATDGNLSVHARKLEEAGYIAAKKFFDGRVPKTEFRITPAGHRALQTYLDHMEALIRAMKKTE